MLCTQKDELLRMVSARSQKGMFSIRSLVRETYEQVAGCAELVPRAVFSNAAFPTNCSSMSSFYEVIDLGSTISWVSFFRLSAIRAAMGD